MAGGTAVAVYLNHRVSVDIDLFTGEEFYCGPHYILYWSKVRYYRNKCRGKTR